MLGAGGGASTRRPCTERTSPQTDKQHGQSTTSCASGLHSQQGCQEPTKAHVAQVRKNFGLRDKPVRVVNALLDTAAERELLEPALTRWQQTAMGAVASTGLELHVACHRLSWLTHRCACSELICCNCAGRALLQDLVRRLCCMAHLLP